MNTDNRALSFGTAINLTGFEEGAAQIEQRASTLGARVEEQSARINAMLTKVPEFHIDVSSVGVDIDTAMRQCIAVITENEQAIEALEAEYRELAQVNQEAVSTLGNTSQEANETYNLGKALRENIDLRKQVLQEARETSNQLEDMRAKHKAEAQAADQSAQAQKSLRQEIRELENAMAAYVRANGTDQTEEYRAMAQELGRLKDIRGDIQAQGAVFANDEQNIAGVIQGLSGLSGAFSAATGVVGLFGQENEQLQQIMLKVQSLMAITMGLQQVQQVLNKDSAFQQVTLNGLKEWWARIVGIAKGQEVAENAALKANTAATGQNVAATEGSVAAKEGAAIASQTNAAAQELSTTATETNTAAEEVNTAVTKSGALADKGAAVAKVEDTAAQGAQTASAVAGTAANFTLAGAFRAVGAAIASIPVFGWIAAAIGAIIAAVSYFVGKANEAEEAAKKVGESVREAEAQAAQTYAAEELQLRQLRAQVEKFNGTQKQEKELCEQLNKKYGDQLGYYYDVASWKQKLGYASEMYMKQLRAEAMAQAMLNEYTKAYVAVIKGEDVAANKKVMAEMERQYDNWVDDAHFYADMVSIALSNEGGKGKKRDTGGGGHGGSSAPTFDAEKASRDWQKAIADWQKARKEFLAQAQNEYDGMVVDLMEQGKTKELNTIRRNAEQRKKAWQQNFEQLAETFRNQEKAKYLAQGHTEEQWEETDTAKMPIAQYAQQLLAANKDLKAAYEQVDKQIADSETKQRERVTQAYDDALVEQFGSTYEKVLLLQRQWQAKLAFLPPEYLDEAMRQLQEAEGKLYSEGFKASIDWDSVMGNLNTQSLQSLQQNLERVRKWFNANKSVMGVEEIKEYQDAITKMEDAIAARNPFAALHKSINDIAAAKTQYVAAVKALAQPQQEFTAAQEEYNAAFAEHNALLEQAKTNKSIEQSDEFKASTERLATATLDLNRKRESLNRAENGVVRAQNDITKAYKNVATQIKTVGGVINNLGGRAKNLAAVFSDNVANGIGKALDFMDEVFDATSTVINSIGDVAKGVAKGVETTVDATSQGVQATAKAGAASLSTMEKASVILTVISAALQVATAIANLFNNDDEKQKEIENLQQRIDQLQWELDNAEAVRLQQRTGSALEKVRGIYQDIYNEMLRANQAEIAHANFFQRIYTMRRIQMQAYEKSIEKIADAYAKVNYTADKALGADRYADSRKQLENYAEQQLLINKQIQEEQSKKKTDSGKIADWERDIQELAEKMASLINDMLEEIVGGSAEDIASQLGEAFIEAAKQGEDAMDAWHSKVKEIVADVTKRMLITKFLEEPLGNIFNQYKKRWFGDDGKFKGIDTVIASMDNFSADLNQVGETFSGIWQTLPDNVKEWFDDSEREGTQRGIATASQDSVDENNARLTTIQGHTYTLVQGMQELNSTSNQILLRVTGIERNTDETNTKLDAMASRIRRIEDDVNDIAVRGIKLKS